VIHYHGTPCGGEREQVVRFLRGRHAMVSHQRPEDIGAIAEVCQSFALDNGAYTAWRSGSPIDDWTLYYDWARLWSSHPGCDWAIIPDIVAGSEDDNDHMIGEWVDAMGMRHDIGVPVWHLHESIERLVRLANEWPRVCLGSSGEYATTQSERWWRRISEAMDAICDADGRPCCKLHGLRMLDPAIFCILPLASADSTNAVRNGCSLTRFGMYTPPSLAARQTVIADRIEAHQSAAVYRRDGQWQRVLFLKDDDT
jgi:hypothetical protein